MCLNSDSLHSLCWAVRLHPPTNSESWDESQLRDSSIGNQSVGDVGQLETGIDILGVINMIQIFTLFEHLAVTFPSPRHEGPKTLNWGHVKNNVLHIHCTSCDLKDPFLPARFGKKTRATILLQHGKTAHEIWSQASTLNPRDKKKSKCPKQLKAHRAIDDAGGRGAGGESERWRKSEWWWNREWHSERGQLCRVCWYCWVRDAWMDT